MIDKKRNTVKTISYVMILTLIGKFMALFRDVLLGRAYGVNIENNAFLAASQLPRVFFDAVFASAITMSFIPIFNKCMQEGGKKKAFEFSNIFITFVGILMIVLSGLGMIFSDAVAVFSVEGFDQEGLKLTSELLKILFPTLFFTGLTFSFIGILQSLDSFVVPALTSIVFNAVIIGYFFGPDAQWGIYGLAFVYLLGWFMQAAIQVPALYRAGYRFRPSFSWNNGYLKEVAVLLLPVMVSTWVQPFNVFINTRFASDIYEGSAVTGINFANNLYTMIVGVFVLSIMNVLFPKLSLLASQGQKQEAGRMIGQTLSFTLLFVIPMMAGLMSLSGEIIQLIYGGDRFDSFSVDITAQALFYFSLGMVGYALQTVLARAYFAERRWKTPMIGAIIAILSNFLLCLVLAEALQISGLALASALSSTIYGLVLLLPFLKKERRIFDRVFFMDIVKMGAASALMLLVIYGIKPYLAFLNAGKMGLVAYLAILMLLGILVYGAGVLFLRVKGLDEVKRFVKERGRVLK